MCKCSEIVIIQLDVATIQSAKEMPVVVDMIEPLEPCEKKIVQVSKKRRCSLSLDKTISRQHEERNMNLKITSGRNDMEDDPHVSKVEKRRLGPVLNAVTQLLLIDSLFSNV